MFDESLVMAPVWFPSVVDYAASEGRRYVSSILPHTGFLPHTVVKWCDEALQADAASSLPRTLSGTCSLWGSSGKEMENNRWDVLSSVTFLRKALWALFNSQLFHTSLSNCPSLRYQGPSSGEFPGEIDMGLEKNPTVVS